MICQFTFKNYKSFRDEVTLDFQAEGFREFESSLLSSPVNPKKRFLPVSVIYGPNGGGKSGVLEALRSLVGCVLSPIERASIINPKPEFPGARVVPFKLDKDSRNHPTNYELFFRTEKAEYRYSLSIAYSTTEDDYDFHQVYEESLYRRLLNASNPAMLFERVGNKIEMGNTIKVGSASLKINPTMPLISFLSNNFDFDPISDAVSWFESCEVLSNDEALSRWWPGMTTAWKLYRMKDQQQDLQQLLRHMDLGISEYKVEGRALGDSFGYFLSLCHSVEDEKYYLQESEESTGTQRVLALMPELLTALKNGKLLLADELDSNLHPKLLEQIVLMFKDPKVNIGGGQLLFTSHDVSTMRNDVFRRDEIWFAAKDESENSMLYSLSEIKDEKGSSIRSDASFGKQYLEGKYGADPYFKRMKSWGNDEQ